MNVSRRTFAAGTAAALATWPTRSWAQAAATPPPAVNLLAAGVDVNALGVLNVRKYGARGDGATDDTASIQAAIDAAHAAGGGFVFLPNGTYLVSTPHDLVARVSTCLELRAGVILRGESRDGAIVKLGNGVPASAVSCGEGQHGCGVMLLTIDGNRANQINSNRDGNQCCLFTYRSDRTIVVAATFINAERQGFYDSENTFSRVDDIFALNCGSEGFSLSSSHDGRYDNIIVRGCGQTSGKNHFASGVYINGGAIENVVSNVFSQGNAGNGISFASVRNTTGTVNNTLIGFTSIGNAHSGVAVGSNVPNTFVARNRFIGLTSRLNCTAGGGEHDIVLTQANDNIFDGCMQYNSKGGGAGLYLVDSSNNRFDGFETYDDLPSHMQAYGILEGERCSGNTFVNPVFRGGFLSAPYVLHNSRIQGAVGAPNSGRRPPE